jgi:putative flavoprotein involved in K+ transport
MDTTDTVVVGAGQAGLALSRCLTDRGVDHVVLERGRVAERWRSERWDSLRLLTPNWMSRLPGWRYRGPQPDGFMTTAEVAAFLDAYAAASSAPVLEGVAVRSVVGAGDGFRVATDAGTWAARNVVVATGWCDRPAVPVLAEQLSPAIEQVVPSRYRNPAGVPDGGVLVVGASATGVQLAAELRAAGRDVVLAVGRHARIPRTYRGMDIMWWFERLGRFDRTIDEVADPLRARREPSLQLAGGRVIDLRTLQAAGVRLAGRVTGLDGSVVSFAGDLAATAAAADQRLRRLLGDIDRHVGATGLDTEVLDRDPPPPVRPGRGPERVDLRREGVGAVVWATGHRRAYPWLHVPVLDEHGEIRQTRGRTPWPGLYVLGQRFQQHRNSNFLDGVGRDAADVADHIQFLHRAGRAAVVR